jgi:uncharacterized SAM-binding protein YcdF (DUF218 family)
MLFIFTLVALVAVNILYYVGKYLLLALIIGLPLIFTLGLVIAFFYAAFTNRSEIIRAYLTRCSELINEAAKWVYEEAASVPKGIIESFRDGVAWVRVGRWGKG